MVLSLGMNAENIYERYLNQSPLPHSETYVGRAANTELKFDRNLLDVLDKNPEIERGVNKTHIRYTADRNTNGANYDLHRTSLSIAIAELDKSDTLIVPSIVEMQTRKPLLTNDQKNFAGYTESEYTYQEGEKLESLVEVLHMPFSISPVVETIKVKRIILDNYNGITGDMTYGSLILQDRDLARQLGLTSSEDRPAFLNFTPDKIIADTFFDTVLGELTYPDLEKIGIKAHFTDTPEVATLALAVRDLSFKLKLVKKPKPNYPVVLFSENEEWLTDSGIFVGKVPIVRQN